MNAMKNGTSTHSQLANSRRRADAEPSRRELPENFWLRVKPSHLVTTLAINMVTAAERAQSSGRLAEAAVKYAKATRYFEQTVFLYADDQEMYEWTRDQLYKCRKQSEILGAKSLADQELASSSLFLLRQHHCAVVLAERIHNKVAF